MDGTGGLHRDTTAFVREVLMPGGPWDEPRIDPAACRFRLRLGESRIHRWGVYADEAIPARRRVIEYTGERIDLREAFRRRLRPQLAGGDYVVVARAAARGASNAQLVEAWLKLLHRAGALPHPATGGTMPAATSSQENPRRARASDTFFTAFRSSGSVRRAARNRSISSSGSSISASASSQQDRGTRRR